MTSPALRTSDLQTEGIYRASKWLEIQVLLDPEELRDLLYAVDQPLIIQTAGILKEEEGALSLEEFIEFYSSYINSLQEGKVPDLTQFRMPFSSVLTTSLDPLYSMPVGEGRYLIKVCQPVIQMQPHSMHYSEDEGKFRPMIYGETSLTWGLQFSYPQIFQNPKNSTVIEVLKSDFQNTQLFRKVQKWLRKNTMPTPFLIADTRLNSPIRLGKKCFDWIHRHPQLKERGIGICK